jgi:hypothetical protein
MRIMKLYKIIFYELLLVIASVLIFRSLWIFFDRISWMNHDYGIAGSLIAGILVTLISIMRLNKIMDKKRDK